MYFRIYIYTVLIEIQLPTLCHSPLRKKNLKQNSQQFWPRTQILTIQFLFLMIFFFFFSSSLNWYFGSGLEQIFVFKASSLSLYIEAYQKGSQCEQDMVSPILRPTKKKAWNGLDPQPQQTFSLLKYLCITPNFQLCSKF